MIKMGLNGCERRIKLLTTILITLTAIAAKMGLIVISFFSATSLAFKVGMDVLVNVL